MTQQLLQNPPENHYRDFLDAAPDAMIVVDTDGRIALANTEAERQFGYARADLLGQPVERLLPNRFRERHMNLCLAETKASTACPSVIGFFIAGPPRVGRSADWSS